MKDLINKLSTKIERLSNRVARLLRIIKIQQDILEVQNARLTKLEETNHDNDKSVVDNVSQV